MTVKLLMAYGPYPHNAIVTLDSDTEAGLIAAKMALADTTGGVVYVAPVTPNHGSAVYVQSAGQDGSMLVPKTQGVGIKVDTEAPTFGWRDIIGQLYTRGTGAQDPAWAVYNGAIYQYQFAANDEVTMAFHLPHDYVPGTDIHAHVHYSLKTGVVETLTWEFTSVFARGFDQAAFTATPVVTTVAQATPAINFRHMIAETPISSAAGTTDVLFANSVFEVDGLILLRLKLTGNTGAQAPFVHSVDLHYQSTNLATKGKAPSFYA